MKQKKKQPLTPALCSGKDRIPLADRVRPLARIAVCCLVLCLTGSAAFSQNTPPAPPLPDYSDVSYKGTNTPCTHTMDGVGIRFNNDVFVSSNFGGSYEGEHWTCGNPPAQSTGCTTNYLFTTYTNTNNTFYLDDLEGTPLRDYYVQIFEDGVFNSQLSYMWSSTAADAHLHSIVLNSPVRREWYIKYFKNLTNGGWTIVKTVRACAITKIEQVTIEADEICYNSYTPPADGNLHFKIKTIPAIDQVMFNQDLVYSGTYTPGPGCDTKEAFEVRFDPQVVTYSNLGTQADIYEVRSAYSTYNGSSLLPPDNSAKASKWNSYPGLPALQDDFYANVNTATGGNNFDLLSYINGSNVGKAVKIRVHITDGVLLDRYIDAPLIIHAPITATGNTSAANFASGYDTTKYTLPAGSTQVWSATSDPVFAQYGNSTAPPTLRIRDNLVIPAGTSLTIQGRRLEFGPNGKIIVEAGKNGKDGGYLKLDNATITQYNNPCNYATYMWQGIQVQGNTTKDQLQGNHPPASEWQGTIELQNGSELSYAKTGILTCDPASPSATAGGVIVAGNTSFLNNSVSVSIPHYLPPAYGGANNNSIVDGYRATFIGCTFDINADLLTPFTTHLQGTMAKGVYVRGCRFNNSNNVIKGGTHGGTGIGGYDFGVRVDQYAYLSNANPTTFGNGLDNGIKIGAIVDALYPYSVRHSTFTTKQFGVYSSGIELPIIADNTFAVYAQSPLSSSVGTALIGSANYTITRNSYDGGYSGQTVGTLIDNGGSTTSSVFVNTYSQLRTGNLSNNLNQGFDVQNKPIGLQFLCNGYDKNVFAEAARGTNPNQHGMSRNQGSANASAGNTFSYNSTDLYNPAAEVVPITYWSTNCANCIPVNNVGNINIGTASGENTCDYSKETVPLGGGSGYVDPRTVNPNPIKHLRLVHNIGYAMSDSLGKTNKDSAYYWLAQLQTPYGDLSRADLLIEDGKLTEASDLYNSITATYSMPEDENTEFTVWGRKLMNVRIALKTAGLQITELSNAQVDSVSDVALHGHMWARERAQNWLGLYDGRSYEHTFLFPVDSTHPQARKGNIAKATGYIVYPNPVSEYLSVAYTNATGKNAVMQITDVVGKVINNTNLLGQLGSVNIDMRGLQSGVYLYRILENGKAIQNGKVTKQ